jgi:3-phosphoshikimate 1-carboxyvinyltransferase
MQSLKLTPAKTVSGRVKLPGDKSISHRAAIIAALARGNSVLSNFSSSQDCAATLDCLKKLGVDITQVDDCVRIEGVGPTGLHSPAQALDCRNSGSTMRLLAGVLAGQNITATLIGDRSLSSRPMGRVIEPLEQMGARVESNKGLPPLEITGTTELRPIEYELPVASAQVKTSLLLAGLHANGRTSIREPRPTRDHTERMFSCFGLAIEHRELDAGAVELSVNGPMTPVATDVEIPRDISSAAFLIAAAALLDGSRLEVEGVGLNPTRTQFLTLLQSFGLDIDASITGMSCNEPVGAVRISGRRADQAKTDRSYRVSAELIPLLIDELPLLAVVGTQLHGGIAIRDASELRYKESDRINGIVTNLRAMGAEVQEFSDGLAVDGPQVLHGARLDSFGDHRIAMACTIAALLADSQSELMGAESVPVSFPEFFEILDTIVQH